MFFINYYLHEIHRRFALFSVFVIDEFETKQDEEKHRSHGDHVLCRGESSSHSPESPIQDTSSPRYYIKITDSSNIDGSVIS